MKTFLKEGKTNWKYILIVVILAVIVGGGILVWIKTQEIPPVEFPEIEKSERVVEEEVEEITEEEIANRKKECAQSEDPNSCYVSLSKDLKSPYVCEEIKGWSKRISCYSDSLEFFVSFENSILCEKFGEDFKEYILVGFREKAPVYEVVYYKYECYQRIATISKNPLICEKIDSPPFKNSCYIKVAFDLKNPSVCDNLIEVDLKASEKDWPKGEYFLKRAEYLNSKEACISISQAPEPWKIYQDKVYGWEISYPNNFFVKTNGDRVVFSSPENIITLTSPAVDLWGGKYYDDFLTIRTIEATKTLEEWIKERFRLEEFKEFKITPEESGWDIDAIEKIIIGEDIQGYKVHGRIQAYDYTYRYIKYKDKIIEFNTTVFSGSENTPLLTQMLFTFRFLE